MSELCQDERSTVEYSSTLSLPYTSDPSTRYSIFSITVAWRKKAAFGHLQLESSYNDSPTHNSFWVRYSAKSHFTLSDRVLRDLNITFPLCSGSTSVSSKGTNMNFHPQSLP